MSTTLPRTETTTPEFDELGLLSMSAAACSNAGSLLRGSPLPVANFRHVFTVFIDVLLVLDQLVHELLLQVDPLVADLRHAVDGVDDQMEAVQIVQHRHVEGRSDGAFLLVPTDVNIMVICAAVGQPVDQPGIGMEGEDDRFISGEEVIEI